LNIFPVGIKRKYTVFLRFEFVFIYLDWKSYNNL
jgi:hypothetical protein